MSGQVSRSRIERRLQKLESAITDASRMVPHSQKWIEYWDRQFYLYMTGQDLNATRQSPIDAFRAVMHYADNPASLVGASPIRTNDAYRVAPAKAPKKLECRRREEQWFAPMPGEARRLLEEKIEAVRLRMQPAIDSGEWEDPGVTAEQVEEMLHALLEENRIQREEYAKQTAAHCWGRESPTFRRKSW